MGENNDEHNAYRYKDGTTKISERQGCEKQTSSIKLSEMKNVTGLNTAEEVIKELDDKLS